MRIMACGLFGQARRLHYDNNVDYYRLTCGGRRDRIINHGTDPNRSIAALQWTTPGHGRSFDPEKRSAGWPDCNL